MKLWIFFTAVLLFSFACNKTKTEKTKTENEVPNVEEIKKISDAIPEEASVQPKKQRKLLVFSVAWGYKHKVAPWGAKAFEIMAQKTGAYEVVVSDDVVMFEPQNLDQFDAVVFNNTNNEIFLPEKFEELSPQEQAKAQKYDEELKKSFTNFLAGGKGLAVIHAGVASFRKWQEFGEIIGARFDNHPWVAGSTVTLKVEEPDHPLVKAFPDKYFDVTDEIYQVKEPYSRDKLRVLVSIDTSRTNMNVGNIHRIDGDFAMSWIKSYGKGRVFYCALGHEKHIFWDPAILRHLLDGVQFVLGDLECDVTPSAEIQREL